MSVAEPSTRSAQIVGLVVTLVGVALGRFAYPPLIPAMIEAGWLSPAEAAQAGAANLVGYLFGAIGALVLPRRGRSWVRLALLATVSSLLASAWPISALWIGFWRVVAGISGAWLMVRGVSLVLAHTPAAQRGHVGGVTFTGIGLGTLITAAIASALPYLGPSLAWLFAGLCAAIATAVAWRAWPGLAEAEDNSVEAPLVLHAGRGQWVPGLLIAAYATLAVSVVPHAVFWIDFLVRERGLSSGLAAGQWWLVGLGSLLGPLMMARLSQRTGQGAALLICYALTGLAIVAPVLGDGLVLFGLSSIIIGALAPASVSMTSTLLAQMVGALAHARWWAGATLAFAIAQGTGAAMMARAYAQTEVYAPLFAVGAATAGLALLLAILALGLRLRLSNQGGSNRIRA